MSQVLVIAGWIVWSISLVVSLVFALAQPRDIAVRSLLRRFSFLIAIGLTATLLLNISKLHLLWWIPVCYPLNLLLFGVLFQTRISRKVGSIERNEQGTVVRGDGTREDFLRWSATNAPDEEITSAVSRYVQECSVGYRKLDSEPDDLLRSRAEHALLLELRPLTGPISERFKEFLDNLADGLNEEEAAYALDELGEDLFAGDSPIDAASAFISETGLGVGKYINEPREISEKRVLLSLLRCMEFAFDSEEDASNWERYLESLEANIRIWELKIDVEEKRMAIEEMIKSEKPADEGPSGTE